MMGTLVTPSEAVERRHLRWRWAEALRPSPSQPPQVRRRAQSRTPRGFRPGML